MDTVFLKNRRKELKLSQSTLGEKVGVSGAYIQQIENNLKNPSIDTLTKIADALDVSVNDLLSENNLDIPTDKFNEWENFSDATQKFVRILDILSYQISLKADTVIIDSCKYSLKEFEKTAQKVYGKISEQTIHEIGYINAVMDFMEPLQENE